MANIVISFYDGIMDPQNKYPLPAFYDTLIKGLHKHGNNIFVHMQRYWRFNYEQMPENLKQEIKQFKPDLFILFNNNFYLMPKEFSCPVLLWDGDNPTHWSNIYDIKKDIGRYKFLLTTKPNADYVMQEWKALPSQIRKIHLFTEIQPEKRPLKNNICFIGTKFISYFLKTPYFLFLKSNPSEEDKRKFAEILKDFDKNSSLSERLFWERHPDTLENIKNHFTTDNIVHYISDFRRRAVLSSISDLGLSLYGNSEWQSDNYNDPGLIFSYVNTPVYSLKQNQDIYNSHKIGININHAQATEGFSWRVLDIMASNSCLVSNENKQITELFKGIIPTYSNPYDARNIVKKLLENENQREDIVSKCNEIINKKYRFENVLPILEDISGIKLSGNAEKKANSIKFSRDFPDNIPAPIRKRLKYRIYHKIFLYLQKKLRSKGVEC